MIPDTNSFLTDMMERLLGRHDPYRAIHDGLLYLKQIFPVEELHLTYYDAESNLLKAIVVATESGAKRTNMVIPLSKQDIAKILDPNNPEAEIGDMGKPVPSVVRHDRKWQGYFYMSLHLGKDDLVAMVVVLSKGPAPYTPEHLTLFSQLRAPFASIAFNLIGEIEQKRMKRGMPYEAGGHQPRRQTASGDAIIGSETGLKNVTEMARQVAQVDSPVILLGETGVGKEMIAKLIHNLSPRRDGPFIPINCGAIPDTLIDNELFGHEKGAFTGAISTKKGILELADGGTVLLDEVGELPLNAQVRLLRVLQEKTIQRVGGTETFDVNIRIIAATHQNLDKMMRTGRFRSDLWYRLHVFTITIPPLRERKEDIPLLVNHFLEKKSIQMGTASPLPAHADAIAPLLDYDWPGNVRELENIVERALILSRNRPLAFHSIVRSDECLDLAQSEPQTEESLNLDYVISRHIQKVMRMTKGKMSGPGGAAEKLGVHPATLRNRMKKLGIPVGKGKY
jgi:transcriptional regulator with GAF, ATPase, and Fis domain